MHITQQTDSHPENFRGLALTVLACEETRGKQNPNQGIDSNNWPLYYSIVGTVK